MTVSENLLELSSMFRTFLKGISQEWNKHGFPLNQTQFKVLFTLFKNGPLNVSQLACSLTLSSAAITGVTDHLLADGYVEKERDGSDRRMVTITLSEKGRKTVQEILETQREAIESRFEVLPEEDIEHLRRIFNVLNAELEKK
ncbi:MarR family winged helix-turn-helix transcriptional regulator [Gorillibacterium sp. sgz500922]|uniref:MarR family winged helix-turn-helix transcriptional regulator n=1 Tax=Gorillibacterium sp. sgz500922 TaxID=3446694 RepID=UPI003F6812C1